MFYTKLAHFCVFLFFFHKTPIKSMRKGTMTCNENSANITNMQLIFSKKLGWSQSFDWRFLPKFILKKVTHGVNLAKVSTQLLVTLYLRL